MGKETSVPVLVGGDNGAVVLLIVQFEHGVGFSCSFPKNLWIGNDASRRHAEDFLKRARSLNPF
jgi:hypothetical protein